MKVMLPVSNKLKDKNIIAEGFHNADVVCIHDNQLKTTEWKNVKEIVEFPNGLISALLQNKICTIISLSITPMVLTIFQRNGITVYKAQSTNVNENIELLRANRLNFFTAEESVSMSSSACNSHSCSGCNSSCN